MKSYRPLPEAIDAGNSHFGALFRSTAQAYPQRTALVDNGRSITYAELDERTNRWANLLIEKGLKTGDRIAVLLHNCAEYFELELAAAKSGTILAALNWRLKGEELAHCISLVSPSIIFASKETLHLLEPIDLNGIECLIVGPETENALSESATTYPDLKIDPESGLVILYTSGTTGLPKGALISHRAMAARAMAYHVILHVPDEDNFIAWTPLYHMVSTDHGLATLARGGTVWCIDGYQPEKLVELANTLKITWFVLVPGMVGDFVAEAKKLDINPRGIRAVGAMADLIPGEDIAAVSRLLNAPFLNTFGATETGLAPATGGLIPIGEVPQNLSKIQSPFCDLKLVDPEGKEVPPGEPGEASIAGPTIFSGYWENDKTNKKDFRNGRFHMGDVLRRNADGTLDYVDRVKYMIKSGGENIYPAEIETLLVKDARVETAVVVRRPDPKWGEVPVALIVKADDRLTASDIQEICKASLAGYKRPKAIYFIDQQTIPRSTTGKIQPHLLEAKLETLTPA